ncbi:MAG: pyrimidine/purine nucleoside phosphorylase [Magnetococcus sp. MYC-9]
MFAVNEYFAGHVKSLSFQTATQPATIGVMAPGEYTFGTERQETMTVVSGLLMVQLPGTSAWQAFAVGQSFVVEARREFHLRVTENTAYLCTYA